MAIQPTYSDIHGLLTLVSLLSAPDQAGLKATLQKMDDDKAYIDTEGARISIAADALNKREAAVALAETQSAEKIDKAAEAVANAGAVGQAADAALAAAQTQHAEWEKEHEALLDDVEARENVAAEKEKEAETLRAYAAAAQAEADALTFEYTEKLAALKAVVA